MSIDDEHGKWESPIDKLKLFTDRHKFTRLFAEYLNDNSPRKTILFSYGDGGNGKSLLLKFLQEKCCKHFLPETWQQLRVKADDEVADFIQNVTDWNCNFEQVPAVILDFGQQPRGENQPQDPFYGLLMLRRNLATAASKLGYQLKLPLYDFACVWYLHKKGKSVEEIKRLFPINEIVGLIVPFIDLATRNPVGTIGQAVFGIFANDLGVNLTLYLQRRKLKPEQVEEICKKDPDTDLINELPWLLAKDLNASMTQDNAPPRLVLFFDTHEAFWGHQRNLPEEKFFYQDEWLRRLLRALELESGIVIVVAGREQPHWAKATNFPIPQKYLDTQMVGHFSTADAKVYLKNVGILDAVLAEALINYASVAPDQVHPFYLALCADIVLAANKHGTTLSPTDFASLPETANKSRELINRLLRYVDEDVRDAVHALSACRAFEREIYFSLGQRLHFHATEASFRILTSFSFVWRDDRQGGDWYRIHDLLRRLDYEGSNEVIHHAHGVLEQHYRERGNVAEAIYHANRLDWERGVIEWVEVFDSELQLSHYEICRTLLEVRSELLIQSKFQLGNVSQSEGAYFACLAIYIKAKQKYLEAITAYNQALSLAADNIIDVLNNKGLALQTLGDLQSNLAQYSEALQSYVESISIYNQAFNLAPDNASIINNKGLVLQNLGDLQVRINQHSQALQSYQEAIAAYNQALNLKSDLVEALNCKANVFGKLGELQAELGQHQQALESYSEAIPAYNQAFTLNSNYVYALNNKGIVLRSQGDSQVELGQHQQALESYSEAISAYNQVLILTPDYIGAFSNKGIALGSLGNLQRKLAQDCEALQSYSEAISAYNNALTLAPDYINALQNKGIVLMYLGELQVGKLSQESKAFECWNAALAVFSRCLEIAPGDEDIRNLRGEVQELLDSLGSGTE